MFPCRVTAVAFAIATIGVACSSSDSAEEPADGAVRGTAVTGCPGETSQPCEQQPITATVTFHGSESKTVTTEDDGTFSVSLPEYRYHVVADSPAALTCAPEPLFVEVAAGKTSELRVTCDVRTP